MFFTCVYLCLFDAHLFSISVEKVMKVNSLLSYAYVSFTPCCAKLPFSHVIAFPQIYYKPPFQMEGLGYNTISKCKLQSCSSSTFLSIPQVWVSSVHSLSN